MGYILWLFDRIQRFDSWRKRLAFIASSSEIPEHAFGMDSDASDESNAGFDPMVQRFDMSSEPQYFSYHRMQQIRRVSEKLIAKRGIGRIFYPKLFSQQNALFANYLRNALIIAATSRWCLFYCTQRKEDSLSPRFIPVTMEKATWSDLVVERNGIQVDYLKKSHPMRLPEKRLWK